MAYLRHSVVSTQPRNQAHTTREAGSRSEYRIRHKKRTSRSKNLSSTRSLQLSLKISNDSCAFSLDIQCKRMYLGRNACSSTAQWSCGVDQQKHGCSINWKSPGREGSTFRKWWRNRGVCCCAPILFGPLYSQPSHELGSGLPARTEGFHETVFARGERMSHEPNNPEHCCHSEHVKGGAA